MWALTRARVAPWPRRSQAAKTFAPQLKEAHHGNCPWRVRTLLGAPAVPTALASAAPASRTRRARAERPPHRPQNHTFGADEAGAANAAALEEERRKEVARRAAEAAAELPVRDKAVL